MKENELTPLTVASQRLEYPSESDTPFDVVHWPATAGISSAAEAVETLAGKKRQVAEVPADRFFGDLAGSDDAERFNQLRRVLDAVVPGFGIFRIGEGETKVDIYLVGKTMSAYWAGLHTASIET